MIVYDVETLKGPQEVEGGWNNPEAMGLRSAVTYDTKIDDYEFFKKEEQPELIKKLTDQDVLTFNGLRFDNAVLLGNNYTQSFDFKWRNHDLLAQIIGARFEILGFDETFIQQALEKVGPEKVFDGSCSLDKLCWHTLGKRKSGSGAEAPNYPWAKLWQYNLRDVRLTWELYQFWTKHNFVVDGNETVIRRRSLTRLG